MFTGLIEAIGIVVGNSKNSEEGVRLLIQVLNMQNLNIGESIAIQGVCLTLVAVQEDVLAFDVSPETLCLTTLGQLLLGNYVNIERAMLTSTRLGGHYVSGHVDTTARILSIVACGDYREVTLGGFAMPADAYLVPKGSITVDGVSLTINTYSKGTCTLMLIPHTLQVTTLGQLVVGQAVHIEFDYLCRIVAHQLKVLMPEYDLI